MITGRDFVFTGLQPWDITIGSNAKDIALEISKYNRVLYINTPLDKKTYYSKNNNPEHIQRKKVIDGKAPTLRQINSNLWVLDYPFTIWSINFLPDGKLFDLANKINNKKMYQFVLQTINQLQFENYILFIDNDMYRSFYAKEYLEPSLSIYYRRDNMVSSFWKKHACRIEPLIAKKSNCVLTNSEYLADATRQYNKYSYNIGQGIDLSNFSREQLHDTPLDIKDIPRPIIGYTGMLTSRRLDIQLLYNLAKESKKYSFVLVGAEDQLFQTHALHKLQNVFFLGMKNSSLIPQYISAFDICINPQLVNSITIGNYPRKIDEYLALGKPVIATKTDTMSIFSEYIWICKNIKEYKIAIEQALLSPNYEYVKQKRIKFAQTHSWENNVLRIYQCILSHLNH